MSRKLVPNLSNPESRDWWKAIETAARNAPKLDSERTPFPKSPDAKVERSSRGKPSGKR